MSSQPPKSYAQLLKIDYLKDLYPKLPHPLTREQHAYQFYPFDALDGYDEAIAESDRQVLEDPGLTEEEQNSLDSTLAYLCAHLKEQPQLEVTYFCADLYKEGGHLLTQSDRLYQIEPALGVLVLKSAKQQIPIRQIRRLKIIRV
ncbi:MAG: hypothetical protein K6F05_03780 [Succinivibrio sp.]|nr:hypothetical protein [Succinivibrio sp.]